MAINPRIFLVAEPNEKYNIYNCVGPEGFEPSTKRL